MKKNKNDTCYEKKFNRKKKKKKKRTNITLKVIYVKSGD
jgi:hypothetical protein